MAAFTTIAAAVGAGASAVGTYKQIQGGRRTRAAQARQQTVSVRRQRRAAFRESQILRARTIASAQAGGVGSSSAVSGGLGSLSSQLGTDLGFSSQMSGLSRDIASGQAQASFGQALSGIGSSLFQFGGGFSAFQNQQPAVNEPIRGGYRGQLY